MGSMIGAFYWVIPLAFQAIKHQPLPMAQPFRNARTPHAAPPCRRIRGRGSSIPTAGALPPIARGEHWLTAHISRGSPHRTGRTPRRSRLGGQTHGAPPIDKANPIQPVVHDPPISPAHRIGRNIPSMRPHPAAVSGAVAHPSQQPGRCRPSARGEYWLTARISRGPTSHGANSPTIPAWWTNSRGPTHRRGEPHPARRP